MGLWFVGLLWALPALCLTLLVVGSYQILSYPLNDYESQIVIIKYFLNEVEMQKLS